MQRITTIHAMRQWADEVHRLRETIALVPTMGALHEGHLSLIRLARRHGSCVVVSLFVNPTQFNDPEDFKKYPRTLEEDCKLLEDAGVDAVFLPSREEMYPEGEKSTLSVGALGKHLCGATRPGHFEGVVTIVSKLFGAVKPDAALFGEKDYQQLQIIRQRITEQKIPVKIVAAPTVREPDGLAMSSRNRRLSREGRHQAQQIPAALQATVTLFRQGEHRSIILTELCRKTLQPLTLDYVSIVDAETLQPVETVTQPARLAVAVFIDGVRLIDNVPLIPA